MHLSCLPQELFPNGWAIAITANDAITTSTLTAVLAFPGLLFLSHPKPAFLKYKFFKAVQ